MVGALLLLIGVWIFTQTVLGGAVSRLRSYAEEEAEPDDAGPRGSVAAPRRMSANREAFVDVLMSQRGDRYVFGGETSGEKNPNGYDCSEFVQWAMARLGFPSFPDGSSNQIAHARKISVARALATRGALLYHPGHIAVSLGNGKTIEARGSAYGVDVFSAKGRGWTQGGLIPELSGSLLEAV